VTADSSELPLGESLDGWSAAARPVAEPLRGAHVLLRPVNAATDAQPLYEASHPPDGDPTIWTYLPDGPYDSPAALAHTLAWAERPPEDSLYYAIVPTGDVPAGEQRPQGIAAYLRVTSDFGVIEIGHIWFGPGLARTTAATEAIYLLLRHAFEQLGYRRVEWKCNALNAASRRAAQRFGFTFEGVFLRHMVVKGRNRDTAWFAITDRSWPAVRAGFDAWLDDRNFDEHGRQRASLAELMRSA
jgi:RimJ/RimL family protein N-acetyltransferase